MSFSLKGVGFIFKKNLKIDPDNIIMIELYLENKLILTIKETEQVENIITSLNNLKYIDKKGVNKNPYSIYIYYLNKISKISKDSSFINDEVLTTNFDNSYEKLIEKILNK